MTKHVVCTVRDRAADTFSRPFFAKSSGEAVRSFTDEVNRPADQNQLHAHPEDFDLYVLGLFEDDTGMFDVGVPRMVCVGKDVAVR